MSERRPLSEMELTIIGLGLMGGSLALALNGKMKRVTGYDRDPETRRIASEQNIVEKACETLEEALDTADVVCLATPVDRILELLELLPKLIQKDKEVIVFDLGSTKVDVVKQMDRLPANIHAVGGHPICGKEKLSIKNAERTLYYGAPFLITLSKRSTSLAMNVVEDICTALGAEQRTLTADAHDEILGIVSHVPFLLSGSLAASTPENVKNYIGPGYRSTSRLAGTDASMMTPVILSNRENVLSYLEKIVDELNTLIAVISDGDKNELRDHLTRINQIYASLMDRK